MTLSIKARNPNDAFPRTMEALRIGGVALPSRNGAMIEYPEPVSVRYTHIRERVLFLTERDINPFLHFFEPLWMLSGRRDIEFLATLVAKFKGYSDDGVNFAAAYGYRMRGESHNNEDQIAEAIKRLKANPDDRQVVLQIRTPGEIFYRGKDTACNISVALKIRDGKLKSHVFNRSNDAIWGGPAGGTNHPQFTTLQEYIAGMVGCDVGDYTVTTDSCHAYDNPQWQALKDIDLVGSDDPYITGAVKPFNMMEQPDKFEKDLRMTFTGDNWKEADRIFYASRFFQSVYVPMWMIFKAFKNKDMNLALQSAAHIAAEDWKLVTLNWLARRVK